MSDMDFTLALRVIQRYGPEAFERALKEFLGAADEQTRKQARDLAMWGVDRHLRNWTTRDGDPIPFAAMLDHHLYNIGRAIRRGWKIPGALKRDVKLELAWREIDPEVERPEFEERNREFEKVYAYRRVAK